MKFQPGQSGNPAGRPVGSVNRQLQQLRAACDTILPLVVAQALGGHFESQELILKLGVPRLKPVELPVEFSLGDGEAAPVRAVLRQVAAGELSVSSAKEIVHELMPVVAQEAKALTRKPSTSGGSFFNAHMNRVLHGEASSPKGNDNAEVLAMLGSLMQQFG